MHWRSFELRPTGSPPMSPQRRAQIEASRPMFQKRAREQYGLEINAGPFGINSRPALILEKYAESQGKGDLFHKAVMRAYWQQARSIDKPAGVRCIHLTWDNRCKLFGKPERPDVCIRLRPSEDMCGHSAREAFIFLSSLERATKTP